MEKTLHHGSCHCGAVTFDFLTDLSFTVTCNCSMCHRAGSILTFGAASDFTLKTGEDSLTSYRFNKKVIDHLFCKVCGIRAFGRGKDKEGNDTVAVNVRCLDDVDTDALTLTTYDGKSL